MAAPKILLRPGGSADVPRLVEVWRSSVDATHGFVLPADLDWHESRMASLYLPSVDVTVAEVDGVVAEFAGTHDNQLAMLFVDAARRGMGVGSALLRDAVARIPGLTLDVNEQNTQAVGFYLHHGFQVTGRSPVDSDGKPYPLLHMVHAADT